MKSAKAGSKGGLVRRLRSSIRVSLRIGRINRPTGFSRTVREALGKDRHWILPSTMVMHNGSWIDWHLWHSGLVCSNTMVWLTIINVCALVETALLYGKAAQMNIVNKTLITSHVISMLFLNGSDTCKCIALCSPQEKASKSHVIRKPK